MPRSFYTRQTVEVARALLGKLLVHRDTSGGVTSGGVTSGGVTSGIIVETEAYLGEEDMAAHSAAGLTARTRVIFGQPGHAYVYLNYGIHECLNLVAEPEGKAGCVLIRALEPVDGIELMRERRRGARDLASGPGKLTQAMGIGRSLNGADVTRGPLTVCDHQPPPAIGSSPRVGITKSVDLPLRFFVVGNPFVSRLRNPLRK